jgi:hypothetical protein
MPGARDCRRARRRTDCIAVTMGSARGSDPPANVAGPAATISARRLHCFISCIASGPRRPGSCCSSGRAGHTASRHAADRCSAGSLLQLLQSFFHRFVYHPWVVAPEASLGHRGADIRCRYRFRRLRAAAQRPIDAREQLSDLATRIASHDNRKRRHWADPSQASDPAWTRVEYRRATDHQGRGYYSSAYLPHAK